MCMSTLLLSGIVGILIMCGLFISLRILKFPDFTSEASYALGCTTYLFLQLNNCSTISSMIYIFLLGSSCGLATALLMQYGKLPKTLSSLITLVFVFGFLQLLSGAQIPRYDMNELSAIGVLTALLFTLALVYILLVFIKSEAGLKFRAVHANSCYALENKASSLVGLSVANGLIALAGGASCKIMYPAPQACCAPCGIFLFGLSVLLLLEKLFIGKPYDIRQYFIGAILFGVIYRIILQIGADTTISNGSIHIFLSVITPIILAVTYACIGGARSELLKKVLKR